MHKLLIFVAVVACGFAAPVENNNEHLASPHLARPSPINPDIPSDPKPEEKVVLISTEKPLNAEEPAVIKPLGPYAVPTIHKQLTKREEKHQPKQDDNDSSSSEEDSSEEDKKPPTKLKPVPHAGPAANEPGKPVPHPGPAANEPEKPDSNYPGSPGDAPHGLPTPPQRKPYVPKVHQHNEHLLKPSEVAEQSAPSPNSPPSPHDPQSAHAPPAPHTLPSAHDPPSPHAAPSLHGPPAPHPPPPAHSTPPAPLPHDFKHPPVVPAVTAGEHTNDKRDAPAAIAQKEETDVPSKEDVKPENKKAEDNKPVYTHIPHPATISRPIPVAELFAKKPAATE